MGKIDKVQMSLIPATPQYSMTLPLCPEKSHVIFCGQNGGLSLWKHWGPYCTYFCFILFPFLNNFTVILSIPFTQSMNFSKCIHFFNHSHNEILEQIHHPLSFCGQSPLPALDSGKSRSASCFYGFAFSGKFM